MNYHGIVISTDDEEAKAPEEDEAIAPALFSAMAAVARLIIARDFVFCWC